MALLVRREYPDDRTCLIHVWEVQDGVVTDGRTLAIDTQGAPWADEWPPTAPEGVLCVLGATQNPCPRCGGTHRWLTRHCTPVLFAPGTAPVGYLHEPPPDGLHVEYVPPGFGVDGPRYMIVRKERR